VDAVNREKAVATLHSLHRALLATPHDTALPNVELVLSVEDLPAEPSQPLWVQSRKVQDTNLWLIPDFAFWSWDVPKLGTFSEVAQEVIERESSAPWDEKIEKLVWRGKVTMAPKLRRALLDAARGKSWSDVRTLRWGEKDFEEKFLGAAEQCEYKFIAHVEGRMVASIGLSAS
jgi:hypothetical protein